MASIKVNMAKYFKKEFKEDYIPGMDIGNLIADYNAFSGKATVILDKEEDIKVDFDYVLVMTSENKVRTTITDEASLGRAEFLVEPDVIVAYYELVLMSKILELVLELTTQE